MHPDAVIAFPEEIVKKHEALKKYSIGNLTLNGVSTVGFRAKSISEVCKVLKIHQGRITMVGTGRRGVFMANLKKVSHKVIPIQEETTREKYIDMCRLGKEKNLKELEKQVSSAEKDVQHFQNGLVNTIRNMRAKKRELDVARESTTELSTKGTEFDKLLEHPDIEMIEIDNNMLSVYTKMINIRSDYIYEIGKFRIDIYTGGAQINTPLVTMHNLTRIVDNYYHPHIMKNGFPCLGNICECLPQMIGAHQFVAAISVCIQYLKSYTCDNYGRPYCNIDNWPRKRSKKGAKKNEKG